MTRPKVSVCVSTYNHRGYIADCLLSVLSQDVDADVEIWVGDDMSNDGTSDIVAALASTWPGRVRHVLHAERQGPIGNLRRLMALADGDFVAHLDGDDFWLPGKLREQLALMQEAPECAASCTNAFVFDDAREPVGVFSNARSQRFDVAGLLRRGNFLNHSSLLYRARCRQALCELAPPFIDYRMHLTLAAAGGVAYTSKVFVGYRSNSSGSMLVHDNEAVRHQYFEAIESALSVVPRGVRAEACADFFRRVAFRALRLRRPAMLRAWWPRALRRSEESPVLFALRCLGSFLMESMRQGVQSFVTSMLRAHTRVIYFR